MLSGPLQSLAVEDIFIGKMPFLSGVTVRGSPSITGVTTDSLQDQNFGTSLDIQVTDNMYSTQQKS